MATIDFTLSQRVFAASVVVDSSDRVGSTTLACFIDELALEQKADLLRVWYAQQLHRHPFELLILPACSSVALMPFAACFGTVRYHVVGVES